MSSMFSTIDAFSSLTTSVPQWNQRLDDLNGQIALRQIELAQLTEQERPPTARSLRNKGSTESLRPKDAGESPFFSNNEDENPTGHGNGTPAPAQNGHSSPKARPISPLAPRTATASQSPVPVALARNSSQPTPPPTQPRVDYTKLRKRKTESLASGESGAPKYRTRSMIIVYYDSAVQTAFEDLVKFVSGSRNAMRKGKMAAKMAEMRKAAELEVDDEEDEDEDGGNSSGQGLSPFKTTLGTNKVAANGTKEDLGDADDDDAEYTMPTLKFVSTRQMGPSRDKVASRTSDLPSMNMLRGYRRSGNHGEPDIFDELDKGLEWCQSQCEHAAHQFLRDGDCSAEIENIKRKLAEVKEKAEKEVERLKSEEASQDPPAPQRPATKPRGLSSIKVRKELSQMKDLEVDDGEMGEMEVDEGIEDDDGPPTLVFKKARDYAR